MNRNANKPVLHGRDHSPGGADQLTSSGVPDGNPLVADASTGFVRWGSFPTPPGQFKPQIQWIQTVDTLTGPGTVGGAITWATGGSGSGVYSTLLDLTPASGTHPSPLQDGWYQAALDIKFTGCTGNDPVSCVLGNNVLGGSFSPDISASTLATAAGDAAVHVSLPTIHLTTSDFFVCVVSATAAGGGTITFTADLLVSLMLTGDP